MMTTDPKSDHPSESAQAMEYWEARRVSADGDSSGWVPVSAELAKRLEADRRIQVRRSFAPPTECEAESNARQAIIQFHDEGARIQDAYLSQLAALRKRFRLFMQLLCINFALMVLNIFTIRDPLISNGTMLVNILFIVGMAYESWQIRRRRTKR